MTEADKIARLKHLTESELPTLARTHHWPIRLDHCFKRICFDHAFQAPWHHHIPRPAERHLTGPALDHALQCAEDLAASAPDPTLLQQRNRESLLWRGKLKSH